MKKTIILLFFISLFTASAVKSQNQPATPGDYKNIFKVSVAKFARNTFQMGVEHYFNPNTSFLFCAGMNYRDSDFEQYWGVNTEAQLKFHLFYQERTKVSHRLYFAPYLMNNYEEREYMDYSNSGGYNMKVNDSFDAVSAGILFGWSFTFANRFNLDIYTGGGIQKTFGLDHEYYDGVFDYGYSGITPRLGIDLGFLF